MTPQELIVCALDAQKNSYAPYSHFNVGAALITQSGKVYTGCNIENGAYSPSVCAERVAFFKAISDGENKFDSIAIVGSDESGAYKHFCSPCGVCRQVMREFCTDNFKIIMGDDTLDCKVMTLSELLPESFSL